MKKTLVVGIFDFFLGGGGMGGKYLYLSRAASCQYARGFVTRLS
jgi:hypothetical protein